jgi:PAS domain S-box-containing protein
MENISNPIHILLIEDNKFDREVFKRSFNSAGVACEITECVRAEEALELVRDDVSRFDVAVIDNNLPGITGLELCKIIRKENMLLPLVLLTGTGSEEVAVRALEVGVDDYIIKGSEAHNDILPITIRNVVKKHAETLARKKAEDALNNERNLFIAGPVVVFKWRNEEGWPVEYLSPNVYELLGYRAEEFLSGEVAYSAIIHTEDIKRVAEELETNTVMAAKNFTHVPYRIEMKDGSFVWLYDQTTIIRDEEGKATHYLGYVMDITERKEAEEKLGNAYEELAAKSERLERFHKMTVGRELEMIRLKEEVNGLLERAGEPKKYSLPKRNEKDC